MKLEEFIYWLEGFLETNNSVDAKIIKNKLKAVKDKIKEPIQPASWPSSNSVLYRGQEKDLLKD